MKQPGVRGQGLGASEGGRRPRILPLPLGEGRGEGCIPGAMPTALSGHEEPSPNVAQSCPRKAVGMAPLLACLLLLFLAGCPAESTSTAPDEKQTPTQSEQAQYRGPLLRNAIHVLNHLEQFDETPAVNEVIDRLNQWVRAKETTVEWNADPLIDTLPKKLRSGDWLGRLGDQTFDHDLDGQALREATWLRDVSNSARNGKLDDLTVAEQLFDWTVRNIQLIDDPKQPADVARIMRRTPADVLLFGEGTALQRAWVFIGLARQQRLDVVLLAVADPDHPDNPRPWTAALVHDGQLFLFDCALGLPIPGPDGKGIATLAQAAENEKVLNQLDLDESHHYPIKSADVGKVFALVEASPGYLSQRMKGLQGQLTGEDRVVLSVAPSETAGRLKGIAHVSPDVKLWPLPFEALAKRQAAEKASPAFRALLGLEMAPFKVPPYLGKDLAARVSSRQRQLDEIIGSEESSVGEQKVTREGSVVSAGKGSLAIVELANGRQLTFDVGDHVPIIISGKHGKLEELSEGTPVRVTLGAKAEVVAVTTIAPSAAVVSSGDRGLQTVDFPLWAGRLLHFQGSYDGEAGAKHFYMEARPGDGEMDEVLGELADRYKTENQVDPTPQIMARYAQAVGQRKRDATFWLGLISFDEKQYDTAADYFRWSLKGPWNGAATYNLARCYEATGHTAEAIKLLQEDDSAQRFGNHLRAQRLK